MKKIIFILVILSSQLRSQQGVDVKIYLDSPLPAKISDWMNNPNAVSITISEAAIGQLASLDIWINLDGTEVARKHHEFPIVSDQQEVTARELDFNTFTVDPSIKNRVATTNLLPEGNYSLCVKFTQGDVVVEPPCEPFNILIPDPPNLLRPANGDAVNNYPQFNWTPVTSLYPSTILKYRIKIVPVFSGQTSRDAIDRNPVLVYDSVFNTTYVYTSADQPFSFFSDAEKFAWQVEAVDINNIPVARNEGKSEIFTFNVEDQDSMSLSNIEAKFYSSFLKLRGHHSNNKIIMDLVDSLESDIRYIFNAINSPDTSYITSLAGHADLIAGISSSPPDSIIEKKLSEAHRDTKKKHGHAMAQNNSPRAFQPIPFTLTIFDIDSLNKKPYYIRAIPWALRDNKKFLIKMGDYRDKSVLIDRLVAGVYDIWAIPVKDDKLRFPKREEDEEIPIVRDSLSIYIQKEK